MRYAVVYAALAASVSAHGFVRTVEGKNGVTMPGSTVTDKTPRNCIANNCGAQADTGIIRDAEITDRTVGPLGKTQGSGAVDPERWVSIFMGLNDTIPSNAGNKGVGKEDDIPSNLLTRDGRMDNHRRQVQNMFGDALQGLANLPVIGGLGVGGSRVTYPVETLVGDTAGVGAAQGLPTTDDDCVVNMVWRQVNQDGAGPLTCAVDATSGGYDPSAFKSCKMVRNAPGVGITGLSLATNTDFPITAQVPQGMLCEGKVGGAENVCVMRIRNAAFAGPFGGSGGFTLSDACKQKQAGSKR